MDAESAQIIQVVVNSCSGHFIPCEVTEFLSFLRNLAITVGVIAIPVVIHISTKSLERKRATVNLIKSFTTEKSIVDRMAKLYKYRLYEEFDRSEGDKSDQPENPYASHDEITWDHVIVLNYFEAACTEINHGLVEPETVFRASGPTIVGVRDIIRKRFYEKIVHKIEDDDYPEIDKAAKDFCVFSERINMSFENKIPNSTKN